MTLMSDLVFSANPEIQKLRIKDQRTKIISAVLMTPERWRQVEEIFQTALDLKADERARYVSVACAEDVALRRDVETLLSQHESAGDLLEEPLYGHTELSALSVLGDIESLAD